VSALQLVQEVESEVEDGEQRETLHRWRSGSNLMEAGVLREGCIYWRNVEPGEVLKAEDTPHEIRGYAKREEGE